MKLNFELVLVEQECKYSENAKRWTFALKKKNKTHTPVRKRSHYKHKTVHSC